MDSSASTVQCPSCHAVFPLTDALAHRLREQMAGELAAQKQAQDSAAAARETKIREQLAALEQDRMRFDEQVQSKIASERQELLRAAAAQAEEKLGVQLKDFAARAEEQARKIQESRQIELDLRKRQRQIEEEKQALEVEAARRLNSERAKIRDEAVKSAAEAERLRLAEKDKLIDDLTSQINTLKQKAEQGSMQLQGEVLELDLEARLRSAFPHDTIEPVAKGQRGADVMQRVRTNLGAECGAILWEAKRARHWSRDWPIKLKEDQREAKADLAVLISQVLPDGVEGFGGHDGVWVASYAAAVPLAFALRHGLLQTAVARETESGRQGKMDVLYRYLTSLEFRQRIEGIVEGFTTMRQDLDAEKRAFAKHWARREKQLESAIFHAAALYGSVQGIVGSEALPEIAPLQLEPPQGGKETTADS